MHLEAGDEITSNLFHFIYIISYIRTISASYKPFPSYVPSSINWQSTLPPLPHVDCCLFLVLTLPPGSSTRPFSKTHYTPRRLIQRMKCQQFESQQ
jgi:hypothetical protein